MAEGVETKAGDWAVIRRQSYLSGQPKFAAGQVEGVTAHFVFAKAHYSQRHDRDGVVAAYPDEPAAQALSAKLNGVCEACEAAIKRARAERDEALLLAIGSARMQP